MSRIRTLISKMYAKGSWVYKKTRCSMGWHDIGQLSGMSSIYIIEQELSAYRKWPSDYIKVLKSMGSRYLTHTRCRWCDYEIDEITPYRNEVSIRLMRLVVIEAYDSLGPIKTEAINNMRKTKDTNMAILHCRTKNAYIYYACEEVLGRNVEKVRKILDVIDG